MCNKIGCPVIRLKESPSVRYPWVIKGRLLEELD